MAKIFFALFLLLPVFSPASAQSTEPLSPQKAFRPALSVAAPKTLLLTFSIAPGYYLYRSKFDFSINPSATLGSANLPKGTMHEDEFFGMSEIYRDSLDIHLPVGEIAQNKKYQLRVKYQGCADLGVCYPPEEKTYSMSNKDGILEVASSTLDLIAMPRSPSSSMPSLSTPLPMTSSAVTPISPSSTKIASALTQPQSSSASKAMSKTPVRELPQGKAKNMDTAAAPANPSTAEPAHADMDEISRIAESLQQQSVALNLFFFFASGLLLTFTPCVLPMIPILSSILVGRGRQLSYQRAWLWSGLYVLGMALVFALLGLLAGTVGTWLTVWMQRPVVLIFFALLFVALALSLFGFYELNLPASVRNRLDNIGRTGSAVGVFLMGAASAVVVGPCLTPPLAGAVLYLAQNGNPLFGAASLFLLALGMGLPVIVVAVSSHAILPKPGVWMESVKHFFGWLLLALAWWTVSSLLPIAVVLTGWAVLFFVLAIFLRALDPLPPEVSALPRVLKALGVATLIYATLLLIGAAGGAKNPLKPLIFASSSPSSPELSFQTVSSQAEIESILATANNTVMIDFYADWCVACKEMENLTFSDERVRAKMRGLRLLRIDLSRNTNQDHLLMKQYGVIGPPVILFFDKQGQPLSSLRVVGYQNANTFLTTLNRLP